MWKIWHNKTAEISSFLLLLFDLEEILYSDSNWHVFFCNSSFNWANRRVSGTLLYSSVLPHLSKKKLFISLLCFPLQFFSWYLYIMCYDLADIVNGLMNANGLTMSMTTVIRWKGMRSLARSGVYLFLTYKRFLGEISICMVESGISYYDHRSTLLFYKGKKIWLSCAIQAIFISVFHSPLKQSLRPKILGPPI